MAKFEVTARYYSTTIIEAKDLEEAEEKADEIDVRIALAESLDPAQEAIIVNVEEMSR